MQGQIECTQTVPWSGEQPHSSGAVVLQPKAQMPEAANTPQPYVSTLQIPTWPPMQRVQLVPAAPQSQSSTTHWHWPPGVHAAAAELHAGPPTQPLQVGVPHCGHAGGGAPPLHCPAQSTRPPHTCAVEHALW